MNPIFFRFRILGWLTRPRTTVFAAVVGVVLLVLGPCLVAQTQKNSNAEFKQMVEQISQARLDGTAESDALQEKALGYLDAIVTMLVSSSTAPDLDAANQQLAGLVSHDPPVGEDYRLMRLGGNPAVYALAVNFGLGGPAAVRIYAGMGGHHALTAKIDTFAQKDFYDSDIELIPMSKDEPVFVIVSGRTDDLATGMFSAWRFDGHNATLLWSSDLLQQSSYEVAADGFRLTYCAGPDEDHPGQCPKMARDLYRFQGGEWKRIETIDLGPSKSLPK